MNSYKVEITGNKEGVLIRKINGDLNGSDDTGTRLSPYSARSVIDFVGKTERILREIGDADCTDAVFLVGTSNTKLSDDKAGYLIESGKAMISTSTPTMDTETQTIKDEAPRVEACAFATYIHPYLCGCLLLEMLRHYFRCMQDWIQMIQQDIEQTQQNNGPTQQDDGTIQQDEETIQQDDSRIQVNINDDVLEKIMIDFGLSYTELKKLLKEADTDEDGMISDEEFVALLAMLESIPY